MRTTLGRGAGEGGVGGSEEGKVREGTVGGGFSTEELGGVVEEEEEEEGEEEGGAKIEATFGCTARFLVKNAPTVGIRRSILLSRLLGDLVGDLGSVEWRLGGGEETIIIFPLLSRMKEEPFGGGGGGGGGEGKGC